MNPTQAQYRVLAAMEKMDKKTERKLLGSANFFRAGTRFSHSRDLLHEAFARALDGRRVWHPGVDFSAHLFLAMRSIADADRQSHANLLNDDSGFDELVEWGVDAELCHPSAEALCIKAEERAAALELASRAKAFWARSGDDEASAVIDAMLDDLDSHEIGERLALHSEAVRLAKRRVLRKLAKLTRL